MYKIIITDEAEKDIAKLKKSEPFAFKKVIGLLDELMEHPYIGTGKPKPLTGHRAGQWSRRITDKHRLVYTVEDGKLKVLILSSSSHYGDK